MVYLLVVSSLFFLLVTSCSAFTPSPSFCRHTRHHQVQRRVAFLTPLCLAKTQDDASVFDAVWGELSKAAEKRAQEALDDLLAKTNQEDIPELDLDEVTPWFDPQRALDDLMGKNKEEASKNGDPLGAWVDSQIKEALPEFLGGTKKKTDDDTEEDALRAWVNTQIQKSLPGFMGGKKKDPTITDVAGEIIKQGNSARYKLEDLVLLCKILMSFGLGLTPVGSNLPTKVLLGIFNTSLAKEVFDRIGQRVRDQLVLGVAGELDQRFTPAFLGSGAQVGEDAKNAVLEFIGKNKYEPGDLVSYIRKLLRERAFDDVLKVTGIKQTPTTTMEWENWEKMFNPLK